MVWMIWTMEGFQAQQLIGIVSGQQGDFHFKTFLFTRNQTFHLEPERIEVTWMNPTK